MIQALRTGQSTKWRVEVWSWSYGMSRVYRDLQKQFQSTYFLYRLDPYREQVVGKVACRAGGNCPARSSFGQLCHFSHVKNVGSSASRSSAGVSQGSGGVGHTVVTSSRRSESSDAESVRPAAGERVPGGKYRDCKFWLSGSCRFSEEACNFKHDPHKRGILTVALNGRRL